MHDIYRAYLFPLFDIAPFTFILFPDCFIVGSSPQKAIISFGLSNLVISPNSPSISAVSVSPIP